MSGTTKHERLVVWTAVLAVVLGGAAADCKKESAEGAAPAAAVDEAKEPMTLQGAATAAMGDAAAAPDPAPAAPPVQPTTPVVVPDKPFVPPQEQIAALADQLKGLGAGGAGVPGATLSPASGAGGGADPCEPYVAKMMACLSTSGLGADDPALAGVMAEGLGDACEAMRDALGAAPMSAALAACANAPCGEGGAGWAECVVKAAIEATGGGPAPTPPPGPEAEDTPPVCIAYADKMFSCMTETMGAALPASVVQETRAALLDGCAAIRDAGPMMATAFERAMAACADHRCGEGGSEWAMCISDALTRTMTGGL